MSITFQRSGYAVERRTSVLMPPPISCSQRGSYMVWEINMGVCPRLEFDKIMLFTGPRSAVGNVSGYRYVSDCRSRGCEFDPGPVPYFRGD